MNKVCSRILIDIDALLDTRSGTLFSIDPAAAIATLKNKTYAGRIIDFFPLVDMRVFSKKYANRDKSILKFSSITNTLGILHDFIQRVMNKNLNSPVEMDIEIHLNIHPFVLSDYEKKLLTIALASKLPLKPIVKLVDYSLENLNPYFVKTNYNTLVLYDFFTWVELHSKNELIKKHPIPEVTIFAPAILKHIDTDTTKDLPTQFTNVMTVMQPFVGLILLPADVFCSYLANSPFPDAAVKEQDFEGTDDEENKED